MSTETSKPRVVSLADAIRHCIAEFQRIDDELIDWLRRHPLPNHSDAKLIEQVTKAGVPKGGSGEWDWRVWTVLNNAWIDGVEGSNLLWSLWQSGNHGGDPGTGG